MLTILDTDVLSELRLPSPTPRVAGRFADFPPDDIALAAFTIAEIEYGIALLPARDAEFASRLKIWLEVILATHRVLPFDAGAASVPGRMYAVSALRDLAVSQRGRNLAGVWRSPRSRSRMAPPWRAGTTATLH